MKTFEEFSNDLKNSQAINEFVDPITIAIAAVTVGMVIAEPIIAAYRERKMLKMSLTELIDLKSEIEFKINKEQNRSFVDDYKIESLEEELKSIKFRIDQLDNNILKVENVIKKSDAKTPKILKDLKSNYSGNDLDSILKNAKKDSIELID
jgi:septal ring factor EnvC (AmiA/AmiB activator)